MKKVGLADWRTSNGLPSTSEPRESSLACMTANREPPNQSFEIDREATVCTASRRFLPLCGRVPLRETGLRNATITCGCSLKIRTQGTHSTREIAMVRTLLLG